MSETRPVSIDTESACTMQSVMSSSIAITTIMSAKTFDKLISENEVFYFSEIF